MSHSVAVKPSDLERYGDCAIAVGTRHGKERQITPAFRQVLGARLVTPADLDTDHFGTFSGEVARTLSTLDAARAKARLGMRTAGLHYGVASEASYETLLEQGWSVHEEILLFVDDVHNLEVHETARTATAIARYRVRSIAELPARVLTGQAGQGLIVRPSKGGERRDIVKGLTERAELHTVIATAANTSADGLALVEPDLRAHHNPSRQRVLSRLAYRLAHRLATPCPSCGSPGYGLVGIVNGLQCRICTSPTAMPLSEHLGCTACPHRTAIPATQQWADPGQCPACNP